MNKKSILWCMAFLTFLFFARTNSMPEMPMTIQPASIPVPLDVAITPTQIPTMPTSFIPELAPPPSPTACGTTITSTYNGNTGTNSQ